MKKNGFTLIELLITIAIIGILGVIAGGAIINSLGGAKEDINEVQRQMIISAAKAYAVDNMDTCSEGCTLFVDQLAELGYIEQPKEVSGGVKVTKDNNGKYSYEDNLVSTKNSGAEDTTNYIDFAYTGKVQQTSLLPGTYKLEVWGAQGGSYDSTYIGGKGGYSYGILTLNETTNIFVYVGGQPEPNTTDRNGVIGGFNGGGNGFNRWWDTTYTYGQGGGGASDIRIENDDLLARVIVAGGGSGSTNRTSGYYGGGTSSGTGFSGYEATSTAAGINGSFGTGGSATTSGINYKYGSAGGGGGWYGGGASSDYSDSTIYDTYSGGGSGYVYTSSTDSNYQSGCLLDSTYYLTNAATIAGNATFTSPNGTNETGHTGDGYVRITKQ